MLFAAPYDAPVGPLALLVDADHGLRRIGFLKRLDDDLRTAFPSHDLRLDATPCRPVRDQLDAYFEGRRSVFDLSLHPGGTAFQRSVWDALRTIPMGRTWTYRRMAEHIGRPKAVRAVGRANATNPIPIVIPCHRLIGSNGSLTGFAGGLDMKRSLLLHEGVDLG